MTQLQIEIITPGKIAYKGEIKSVIVPGTMGSFQVLINHAPVLSSFEIGSIKIELNNGDKIFFATAGGTIEVLNNNIRVLADSLEDVENIDIERAKQALDRAQKRLDDKGSGNLDVKRAEAALARAMNRIKIAEKFAATGIV